MKGFAAFIVKAILGWFSGRLDLKRSIRSKARNDQLEAENEIIDKQNQNNIISTEKSDEMWDKWPDGKK